MKKCNEENFHDFFIALYVATNLCFDLQLILFSRRYHAIIRKGYGIGRLINIFLIEQLPDDGQVRFTIRSAMSFSKRDASVVLLFNELFVNCIEEIIFLSAIDCGK